MNPLYIPEDKLKSLRDSANIDPLSALAPIYREKALKNLPIMANHELFTSCANKIIHQSCNIERIEWSAPELKFLADIALAVGRRDSELPIEIWRSLNRDALASQKPSNVYESLYHTKLLRWLLPELYFAFNVSQNEYHKYDIFYHSVYACDNIPASDLKLRVAALFHDLGKVGSRREHAGQVTFHGHEILSTRLALRFCRKMAFDKKLTKQIERLVRYHMFYYTKEWSNSAVKKFYRQIGKELINDLFDLRIADRNANGLRNGIPSALFDFRDRIIDEIEKDNKLKVTDLQINGQDLIDEFCLKPGPVFGVILNELKSKVEQKNLENFRDTLLSEAGDILARLKKSGLSG